MEEILYRPHGERTSFRESNAFCILICSAMMPGLTLAGVNCYNKRYEIDILWNGNVS